MQFVTKNTYWQHNDKTTRNLNVDVTELVPKNGCIRERNRIDAIYKSITSSAD